MCTVMFTSRDTNILLNYDGNVGGPEVCTVLAAGILQHTALRNTWLPFAETYYI